ncbi:MAG: thioredoxin [Pseudoflavonifractor sp.]|nr:thioredoxin [Pseudoflavonifractor sp.]
MALEFNDQTAKEAIESGKPVVIDFWATWCGPCKRIAPIVEKLAGEYEGSVVIGKYNVDDNTDLATEHRIMSIPTLLFFKNGNLEQRVSGALPEDELRKKIETLL